MKHWTIYLIIALLAGCSASSEPEPDPQDIFFDVKGESFPFDLPEPVNIIASHPEGFADASIEVYLNGVELFSKDEQSIGARFDTTFTPQADGPGQLRVEYFLRANADVEDAQGSRSIQIQDTPFAEATIRFLDAVTRNKIEGMVTDQESGQSYEIIDGTWTITRFDQIRKDVLAEGLEVAIQSEGRLPTLDIVVGEEREHYQIPFNAPNFSFEEMLDFMYEFPIFMERPDDRMTYGYPMDSEITAYVADRSTYPEGRIRESTDNENLYIAEGFKQDVLDMLDQFTELTPPNNNLSIGIYIESESDFEFPKQFPDGSLTVSSTTFTPFSVARSTSADEGVINNTYILQKVRAESGPVFESSMVAACEEVIESISALNTSKNGRVLCDQYGPTEKAKPMSYASLSLPPGSSWNYSITATGVDGTNISPVYVVKRN